MNDSHSSPPHDRISIHLETLMDTSNVIEGYRNIFLFLTAAIAVSISHVRACLCKAWHLQDMKINCTRQNYAQRLLSPALLRFCGTKDPRGTEA